MSRQKVLDSIAENTLDWIEERLSVSGLFTDGLYVYFEKRTELEQKYKKYKPGDRPEEYYDELIDLEHTVEDQFLGRIRDYIVGEDDETN